MIESWDRIECEVSVGIALSIELTCYVSLPLEFHCPTSRQRHQSSMFSQLCQQTGTKSSMFSQPCQQAGTKSLMFSLPSSAVRHETQVHWVITLTIVREFKVHISYSSANRQQNQNHTLQNLVNQQRPKGKGDSQIHEGL